MAQRTCRRVARNKPHGCYRYQTQHTAVSHTEQMQSVNAECSMVGSRGIRISAPGCMRKSMRHMTIVWIKYLTFLSLMFRRVNSLGRRYVFRYDRATYYSNYNYANKHQPFRANSRCSTSGNSTEHEFAFKWVVKLYLGTFMTSFITGQHRQLMKNNAIEANEFPGNRGKRTRRRISSFKHEGKE